MRHHLALTLITLALMVVVGSGRQVDCDSPDTWATPSGVQACAVNGGK